MRKQGREGEREREREGGKEEGRIRIVQEGVDTGDFGKPAIKHIAIPKTPRQNSNH